MKYLNWFLVFLPIIYSCSGSQKNPDCSNLRRGKFEYRGLVDHSKVNIERNDSVQTEADENTGIILKLKIEWSGSCNYKLTFLSAMIKGKEIDEKRDFPPIMTTIQKVTKNYYICRSVTGNEKRARIDTMIILKPTS